MATNIKDLTLPEARTSVWPTMYELPDPNDHEGMPDEYHLLQAMLLLLTFRPPGYFPDRCFSAGDMNLYFDPRDPAKRPDWFGVIGVGKRYRNGDMRSSYATWDEGVNPFVIVELLSRSTARADLGEDIREQEGTYSKWEVYERLLKVPYYVIFSKRKIGMTVYRHDGERLKEVGNHGNRIWMPEAGLGLGLWRGEFNGFQRLWLRFYDRDGDWIPTPTELADQAEHSARLAERQAERERAEKNAALRLAETERLEKEKLAAKLRELGIDPDAV